MKKYLLLLGLFVMAVSCTDNVSKSKKSNEENTERKTKIDYLKNTITSPEEVQRMIDYKLRMNRLKEEEEINRTIKNIINKELNKKIIDIYNQSNSYYISKPSYKELRNECYDFIDILESNGISDYEVPSRNMSYRQLEDLRYELEDLLNENEIEY